MVSSAVSVRSIVSPKEANASTRLCEQLPVDVRLRLKRLREVASDLGMAVVVLVGALKLRMSVIGSLDKLNSKLLSNWLAALVLTGVGDVTVRKRLLNLSWLSCMLVSIANLFSVIVRSLVDGFAWLLDGWLLDG